MGLGALPSNHYNSGSMLLLERARLTRIISNISRQERERESDDGMGRNLIGSFHRRRMLTQCGVVCVQSKLFVILWVD